MQEDGLQMKLIIKRKQVDWWRKEVDSMPTMVHYEIEQWMLIIKLKKIGVVT